MSSCVYFEAFRLQLVPYKNCVKPLNNAFEDLPKILLLMIYEARTIIDSVVCKMADQANFVLSHKLFIVYTKILIKKWIVNRVTIWGYRLW